MNLIADLLERFPASKPALLVLDREGVRRVWHFGELIAMSAGLSGAFAARGVGRGDVVMTLVGNRLEWVLSLLACWRMGAVALPRLLAAVMDPGTALAASGPRAPPFRCASKKARVRRLNWWKASATTGATSGRIPASVMA